MVLQAEREIKAGQEIAKFVKFEIISGAAKAIEFGAAIAGLATKTGEGALLALIGGTVCLINLMTDTVVLGGTWNRVRSILSSSDSNKKLDNIG